MVAKLSKKQIYKIELGFLKVIPILIAVIYTVSSFTSYFGLDIQLLSILGGTSFVPLMFILVSSFCFEFCIFHRIFIYYILALNCINYYDWYIGIPVSDKNLLIIVSILFMCSCSLALFFYLRRKKYDEDNKRITNKDNK